MSADRDQWMRRTGPLYPLLVAALLQTRLPIARTLSPSVRDERSSLPWLSVVGVLLGLILSASSWGLGAVGLRGVASASLLAVMILLAGGLWCEHAVARLWAAFADRRGMRRVELSLGVVVAVVLVLRTGFLAGTPASAWVGALLVSSMTSRLVASVVLMRGEGGNDQVDASWGAIAVMALVVLCISIIVLGALALLVLLAAAGVLAAFALRRGSSAADRAATSALIVELAVLVLVAARG